MFCALLVSVYIALTVDNGMVAPVFPGVALHLVRPGRTYTTAEIVNTAEWPQMDWGKQLLRRNTSVLVCSGLEQFQWGMFQGYGIDVYPNFIGRPEEALEMWRSGKLKAPDLWPLLDREKRNGD